jgi:hypothetical protein
MDFAVTIGVGQSAANPNQSTGVSNKKPVTIDVLEIKRAIANAVGCVVARRRLMRRVLQEVDSAPNWDRRLPLSAPMVTPASGPWPHRAADATSEVAPRSKLGTRPLGDRVFHFLTHGSRGRQYC